MRFMRTRNHASPPRPVAAAADRPPGRCGWTTYHTGNATEERFSLDRVVLEPLPWPGNPARPIDDTNLGKYFFEVVDRRPQPGPLLARASRRSTASGRRRARRRRSRRTFSESLRFPAPDGPVQIVAQEARRAERLPRGLVARSSIRRTCSSTRPTPASPGPAPRRSRSTGDPAEKVDFLILGDGYTAAERGKFEKDARRLAEILFAVAPFKERRADFNVWGALPAVGGVGHLAAVDRHPPPLAGRRDATTRSARERYVLTFENRAFRDVASFAPYEFVEILTNTPDLRRRRHLRPLLDRRGRQPLGALRLRPRVRPPLRGARRRVLHVRRRLRAGDRRASSRGSRTSRRSSIRRTSSGRTSSRRARRCRRRGRRRSSRSALARVPGEAPRRSARRTRPEEEMDALFRQEQESRRSCLGTDQHAGQGRRVRGRDVRGEGLLPAAGGLHHVHARRRALLRRLPARDSRA